MTFDAALSGGQQATVVQREDAREVQAETLSDQELQDKAEQMEKKIEDMTEEELNEYLERSAQAAEELEAVGATETGQDVDVQPAYAP